MARRRYRHTVEIETLNIGGEDVEVKFYTNDGKFHASYYDNVYSDTDFNKLVRTLKAKAKEEKPSVNLLITKAEEAGNDVVFEDYVVTGIHGGTKNILARDSKGELHQIGPYQFGRETRYDNPRFVRRLTALERADLNRLHGIAKQAERAFETKKSSYAIKILKLITDEQRRQKKAERAATERLQDEGDPRV